eukprot:g1574.t1 g1574   contig10:2369176-2371107(+)
MRNTPSTDTFQNSHTQQYPNRRRRRNQTVASFQLSFIVLSGLAMMGIVSISASSSARTMMHRTFANRRALGCFVSQSASIKLEPTLVRRQSSLRSLPFFNLHPLSASPSTSSSSLHMVSTERPVSASVSSTTNKTKASTHKPKKKTESNTGRLRLLPPLNPATEILSRAQRLTAIEVKDDTKITNVRRRTQKRGAQTIDLLSQKLCAPLKTTVQTYQRELRTMHPFEKVVMELTIQARQKRDGLTLANLLEEVHEGRKELLQLSKDWISKIKSSPTARESYECTEEAKEVLGKVFLDLIQEPWSGIMELQKSLRNVPIVRLDCPAVVLVGAPNVGKSSIVRAISSGTPEVNNYPFTTRGMTLGHVQVFWESDDDVALGNVAGVSIPSEQDLVQEKLTRRGIKTRRMKEKEAFDEFSRKKENERGVSEEGTVDSEDGDTIQSMLSKKSFPISQLCQIMDSPGLLRRDEGDSRNEMEELTLAAMSHLPTAVMYVMDLSGGAGDKCSSVEDQLILRREVKARFPRRPWIDVVSKTDLGIVDGAKERLAQILEAEQQQRGGSNTGDDIDDARYFIELSIKEGQGVEELRQEVMRMLGEVRVVLDAMAAMDERSARA